MAFYALKSGMLKNRISDMTGKNCFLFAIVLLCVFAASAQFGGPAMEHAVYPERSGVHPGGEMRIALRFELPGEWHVNAHEPLDDFLIPTVLSIEEMAGMTVENMVYPEPARMAFAFSEEEMAVYPAVFYLGIVLRADASLAPGGYTAQASLQYQACNDNQCAPPQNRAIEIPVRVLPPDQQPETQHADHIEAVPWDRAAVAEAVEPEAQDVDSAAPQPENRNWRELAGQFSVAGRLSGSVSVEDFLEFIAQSESGEGMVSENRLAGKSWWLVVALVLAGGLALNLTPCVLPLIPINIGIIGAGARARSKTRGFLLGAVYGLGIALVYGALGLVVVLGFSTAFGTINSAWWFNAAIAALFVVLALAMFDMIVIDFSKYQAKIGIRKNERGSFLIAFAMGCISALLAGACVAPVVISTLLYTQDEYAGGNTAALLLPFLLGAGMALPWPFMGAGLSFLPKPGGWMNHVKHIFGVFILGMALYYGWLAWSIARPAPPAETAASAWVQSLDEGLARAAEEEKPVLIDFWATWCKNCLVMDKTVLKDPEVLEALTGYILIKYQAENLSEASVRDVLEYYGVQGLPAYLILQPEG
jgi:thioredoxin:protein disulfide reductase